MSDGVASTDKAPLEQPNARLEAAALARGLVRGAWKGALATASRESGHPYPSLVAMATQPDGAPLLLLSGLAEHTRNIEVDRRASVLIDGTRAGPAALTGPRVTLVGSIERATTPTARKRYLARHPDAAGFIDFADFALFSLRIEWAHLVAGFGRIVRLSGPEVTISTADACDLISAEDGILDHMNSDHADAVALLAARALAASGDSPAGASEYIDPSWRMIGCDPEGIDLASGPHALRVPFPHRVNTPDAVRQALVQMVRSARASIDKN